jgi:aryl-alcohol dehydrogenase-like predicted oxidoreductase
LVERGIESEISDLSINEGVGIVPWGPLGGGFLSGKYKRGDKPTYGRLAMMPDIAEESWERRSMERNWQILSVMDDIAANYDLTHVQIALVWLLKQPGVDSVIIGARTIQQLKENLKTTEITLPDEEIERLSDVSKPPQNYPYRFIEAYGQR